MMLEDALKNNEAVVLKDEALEQVTGGGGAIYNKGVITVDQTGGAIYNQGVITVDQTGGAIYNQSSNN